MSADSLDPVLRAFADEACRLEPRVRAVSFRPGDHRTVMILELLDVPREIATRLYKALKTYASVNGVDCDVVTLNSTTPKFVANPHIPKGWPPE